MVNNKVNLAEGVDFGRISTKLLHGGSHSGQVNYSGYTGEVLKEDSGWFEWDFEILFRCGFPVENCFDVSS